MKGEELTNVCQAVSHGGKRYVRECSSNTEGEVIRCCGSTLKVQVGTREENWSPEECEGLPPEEETSH